VADCGEEVKPMATEGDHWPPGGKMFIEIERTRKGDADGVFLGEDTHWWDGWQSYGTTSEQQKWLRDGEKLTVESGTIPGSLDFLVQRAGFWTGWAALHTLFALDHNAICEHLRKEEKRAWGEEELFQTARLVNVALMAKIHLMASRRLTSDRFFTDDYNDEHYTKAGLDWINNSSMKTVLLRHFPELAPALGPIENAFAPWVRVVR
jgi:heme peroxidase